MSLLRYRFQVIQQLSKLTGIGVQSIEPLLSIPKLKVHGHFCLNLQQLEKLYQPQIEGQTTQDLSQLVTQQFCIEPVNKVSLVNNFLNFELCPTQLTKSVLFDILKNKSNYGKPENIEPEVTSDRCILVEFSSPNIAKPFHAGHMRTTLIGAFLKNLFTFLEPNTTKVIGINYLGDWGRQYGLLAVGYNQFGDEKLLKLDPLQHLYDVYVKVNQQLLADTDGSLEREAKKHFQLMEQGDSEALAVWTRFRELSLVQYNKIYHRLQVQFDDYSGESTTEPMIPVVLQLLEANRLLLKNPLDQSLQVDLERYQLEKPRVRKSDGTTLYLTRDLASLIQRLLKYNFDQLIYVVGEEQKFYFQQLFQVVQLLQPSIDQYLLQHHRLQTKSNWHRNLVYVGFGKVLGMSTRKGTAVFLQDILDTAKSKMLHITQSNLKSDGLAASSNLGPSWEELEGIADRLGISAVVVQDASARRGKDYRFSWDRMLDAKGNTGIYLQYAYARIQGIHRTTQLHLDIEALFQMDFTKLKEVEALDLVFKLAQFPTTLHLAKIQLDPNPLAHYLLELAKLVTVATLKLRVKGIQDSELAQLRWALFFATQVVLETGMKLLNLRPVKWM